MKILGIHGIGGKDATIKTWSDDWESSIKSHLGNTVETCFDFMKFDPYFDAYDAHFFDYVKLFTSYFRKQLKARKEQKGLKDVMDNYPDMVAEFLLKEDVRAQLRAQIKIEIKKQQTDVIYAHSLGSLMCYDFFMNEINNDAYKNITLITSGSQLGLVSNYLEYPKEALNIKQWYNLNNPKDKVFAKHPLTLKADNFNEIETYFKKGFINHDVLEYINHSETIKKVWNKLIV